MDGGAWRAAVHRVAKRQTQLKWLSTHTSFCPNSIYQNPPIHQAQLRYHPLFPCSLLPQSSVCIVTFIVIYFAYCVSVTCGYSFLLMGFPDGSGVKNPPAVQKTQGGSLGREDPLEKGMKTHSSILAWRFLWTKELGGLESIGLQRVEHDRSNLAGMLLAHIRWWASCRNILIPYPSLFTLKHQACGLYPETTQQILHWFEFYHRFRLAFETTNCKIIFYSYKHFQKNYVKRSLLGRK